MCICVQLVTLIRGRSPAALREMFGLPDDFDDEERYCVELEYKDWVATPTGKAVAGYRDTCKDHLWYLLGGWVKAKATDADVHGETFDGFDPEHYGSHVPVAHNFPLSRANTHTRLRAVRVCEGRGTIGILFAVPFFCRNATHTH